MNASAPLIELDGVSVRAGSLHILKDVDLVVPPGESLGVFGSNGAGKTTLLRLVATLIRPASGRGSVLGARIGSEDRYEVRTRIGYIGHVPGLYPEMTLGENLAFVADARGIDRGQARDALGAVGLLGAFDRITDRCSHGMQRRAEFARVLMTRPDLLLLDEPHSALDADAIELVDALVTRTVERGGGAILVSHDRERVAGIATRSVEIIGGTIA
ncbi:MAG TPA: heme ABC exporter ATP-binding protein CcmA [Acidimicrobiia bacterium]|nr:heme ABC exporter ATP-binding protein CcmA [Acidimicrobiia bacterium]